MLTIAIIGKPYPGIIQYIAQHHKEVQLIAFHDHQDHFVYPPEVATHYPLDFKSEAAVITDLKKWSLNVHGVISSYENSNLPLVWIGKYFNVPVPTEKAIEAATDKNIMRQQFMAQFPEITPQFREVQSWEEVASFAQKHHFPLVLKPANLMKSLLVSINFDLGQLKERFEHATQVIADIYKEYGVHHRKPSLLVEEFLDGSSHSVDLVSDTSGTIFATAVVDYTTAKELGISDTFVYLRHLPSRLSEAEQSQVIECATKGVKALKLTNSAAHTEVILTKNGPKIVEIGARFGGYRPRMYEASLGIPIHQIMVDLALGKKISVTQQKKEFVNIFELFPDQEGMLKEITALTEVKKLPSFVSMSQPKKPGEKVGLSKNGYKFCANIILHNADYKQSERDRLFVEKNVRVVLQ